MLHRMRYLFVSFCSKFLVFYSVSYDNNDEYFLIVCKIWAVEIN